MDIVDVAISIVVHSVGLLVSSKAICAGFPGIFPHIGGKVLVCVAHPGINHGNHHGVGGPIGGVKAVETSIPSLGGMNIDVELGVVVERPLGVVCEIWVIRSPEWTDKMVWLRIVDGNPRMHARGQCFRHGFEFLRKGYQPCIGGEWFGGSLPADFGGKGLDVCGGRALREFDDDLVANHLGVFEDLDLAVGQKLNLLLQAHKRIFSRGEVAGGAKLNLGFLWNRLDGPVEQFPIRIAGGRLGFQVLRLIGPRHGGYQRQRICQRIGLGGFRTGGFRRWRGS